MDSIAEVLALTVAQAVRVVADEPSIHRSLAVLSQIGLSYLRLGPPAKQLSGGEAQRIKLATDAQRGDSL